MIEKQIIIDGKQTTKEDFTDNFSIELTNCNIDERKQIGGRYFDIILRKEQECEYWKHQAELGLDTTDSLVKELEEKEQECEELKEINQELLKYCKHSTTCQECYEDGLEDGKTSNKELRKLKQTLAEIKEIIKSAIEQNTLINLDKILQINEVEDVENN